MADVFISCKQSERAKADALAARLERLGVSVWRDPEAAEDDMLRPAVREQAAGARAVLVGWTPACFSPTDPGWVRWAAERARERGALVATFFQPTRLEPPFHRDRAEDLSLWFAGEGGGAAEAAWRAVLGRLEALLEREGLSALDAALESGDAAALAAWASRHRGDRLAPGIWKTLIQAERAAFEAACAEAREASDREIRALREACDRRLAVARDAFEEWLAAGGPASDRPRPVIAPSPPSPLPAEPALPAASTDPPPRRAPRRFSIVAVLAFLIFWSLLLAGLWRTITIAP